MDLTHRYYLMLSCDHKFVTARPLGRPRLHTRQNKTTCPCPCICTCTCTCACTCSCTWTHILYLHAQYSHECRVSLQTLPCGWMRYIAHSGFWYDIHTLTRETWRLYSNTALSAGEVWSGSEDNDPWLIQSWEETHTHTHTRTHTHICGKKLPKLYRKQPGYKAS